MQISQISKEVKCWKLVENSTISGTAVKRVFDIMFENGKEPKELVSELGLEHIGDCNAILEIVRKVVKDNPKSVEGYRTGKNKEKGLLTGQAVKASKGRGNPQVISKILNEVLDIM